MNKTRGLFYEVGGVFYRDLAEAQRADLKKLIPAGLLAPATTDSASDVAERLADWLLANAEPLVAILTTTARSRIRKPRKDKGVPRKRTEEVKP